MYYDNYLEQYELSESERMGYQKIIDKLEEFDGFDFTIDKFDFLIKREEISFNDKYWSIVGVIIMIEHYVNHLSCYETYKDSGAKDFNTTIYKELNKLHKKRIKSANELMHVDKELNDILKKKIQKWEMEKKSWEKSISKCVPHIEQPNQNLIRDELADLHVRFNIPNKKKNIENFFKNNF